MTDSKTPDWAKEEASDLYDLVSDAPSTAKAKAEITLALVEAERRGSANLISIIADIREKSGVGAKPMLGELADAISQALLSAYERGRADKERDLAVARQALIDWLHIYAPGLCNSWKVDEARVRVGEHGTIAYIAKALAAFDPPAKENDNER
ncbi:MAG: hypothetical protein KIS86_06435 [Devosia sp.]|nr:hypothetical protein [Devosia sp.]